MEEYAEAVSTVSEYKVSAASDNDAILTFQQFSQCVEWCLLYFVRMHRGTQCINKAVHRIFSEESRHFLIQSFFLGHFYQYLPAVKWNVEFFRKQFADNFAASTAFTSYSNDHDDPPCSQHLSGRPSAQHTVVKILTIVSLRL